MSEPIAKSKNYAASTSKKPLLANITTFMKKGSEAVKQRVRKNYL
jgi:hypothetical protein